MMLTGFPGDQEGKVNGFFFSCFFVVSVLHTGLPIILTSDVALVSFDAVSVRRT